MIGLEDVYKVISSMVPLYVALMLGYGSVKWWAIFTPEQCEAINRFVCYFTLPLFAFEFAAHVDPFQMNYPFMGADVISKALIVIVLTFWAKCTSHSTKDSYGWSITSFSLSNLTNSLVVGVPLLKAMYGQMGVDLVVQSSVFQALVWLTILLFALEVRRTRNEYSDDDHVGHTATGAAGDDLEGQTSKNSNNSIISSSDSDGSKPSLWGLTKVVWWKVAVNPNSYACIVGIVWAFLSNRWHFEMPSILEGSVLIMSRAGTGTAMFSMGLFMALQKKMVACGSGLTIYGLVLRFVAGPIAMAIGSLVVGLHGDVLRVAIIQAAIPQSITSFIFAKEYGLHPDVISTAVIYGMIVCLPLLVGYYAILEYIMH